MLDAVRSKTRRQSGEVILLEWGAAVAAIRPLIVVVCVVATICLGRAVVASYPQSIG
jgi:hypothetical protein